MFRLARGLSPSSYRREWLAKDVVAGVVLSTLLVPQGMAYAELAGLPPITCLYTSILCLLGYAVFDPSRILVLGPDSSLGPMIAATILPLAGANGDPKRAIALASMLALMLAPCDRSNNTDAKTSSLSFIETPPIRSDAFSDSASQRAASSDAPRADKT